MVIGGTFHFKWLATSMIKLFLKYFPNLHMYIQKFQNYSHLLICNIIFSTSEKCKIVLKIN